MNQDAASSPSEESEVLQVRLVRETPYRTQLGCTFVIAIILGLVAALGFAAGRSESESKNNWVAYVVGSGFGLFAILVLWAWIRQMACRGIAETIVELSERRLGLGRPAVVALVQRGPARLTSLRANLLCVETSRRTLRWKDGTTSTHEMEKYHVQQNIFEATHLRIAQGDTWHESREFTPSEEGKPTQGEDGDPVRVRWRIEVWGRAGLGSFMHPFPVTVAAPSGAPPDPSAAPR